MVKAWVLSLPTAATLAPVAGTGRGHGPVPWPPAAVPTGMPDDQREGLQEDLIDIILHVLKRNPQLHYYQGYHDIVVTFLLVVGDRLATALVEKLSTHHLRYAAGGREPPACPRAGGTPVPVGPAWQGSLEGRALGSGWLPVTSVPRGVQRDRGVATRYHVALQGVVLRGGDN